ncbi:uncharacterized protein FOMMEDRAFT_165917, partial [Fomitiporia mediterranea MF3/22]|uniref:uncharacterized protein n=1 Tax=Fomitiporia mediterranea (strain MF3/22) TaxID=694068 RepID=UPI00044093F7
GQGYCAGETTPGICHQHLHRLPVKREEDGNEPVNDIRNESFHCKLQSGFISASRQPFDELIIGPE